MLKRMTLYSLSLLTVVSLATSVSFACGKHNKNDDNNTSNSQTQTQTQQAQQNTNDAPHAYSAFSPAILATNIEVTETQKAMVGQYITTQVAANGLSMQQFASMTPDQQRRILTPGRSGLSREERRVLQLQTRQAYVPNTVQQGIIPLASLERNTIQKYGVMLPTSVQSNLKLPAGVSMVLFGNKLTTMNSTGTILSVVEEIY